MSQTSSFQLPDILDLIKSFELRTSHWCHSVSLSSENWLCGSEPTEPDADAILSPSECSTLSSTKVGLLAALCSPTLDSPQLRLLTDFLTLLLYSNARILSSKDSKDLPWEVDENGLIGCSSNADDGLDLLNTHTLFKHIVPRVRRLASRVPASWLARFSLSVRKYRMAQFKITQDRGKCIIPELEDYIELHRDMSGFKLIFDIMELVEGVKYPSTYPHLDQNFMKLRQLTEDIISWTLDIYSYNVDQRRGNTYNLVSVLMVHKGLSVQGAVNFAGSMVREAFASFHAIEDSILEPPTASQPTAPLTLSVFSLSWLYKSYLHPLPAATSHHAPLPREIDAYIRGLKEYIVGTINWAFETEIYFGKKGEDARTFGWVFLEQKDPVVEA